MKSRLSIANSPVMNKDEKVKSQSSPKDDNSNKPLNFINPEKFIV